MKRQRRRSAMGSRCVWLQMMRLAMDTGMRDVLPTFGPSGIASFIGARDHIRK